MVYEVGIDGSAEAGEVLLLSDSVGFSTRMPSGFRIVYSSTGFSFAKRGFIPFR